MLVPGAECLDLGQGAAGFPTPGADMASRFSMYNNTIYSEQGPNCKAAGGPFSTMADFQAKGYESGPPSTIITTLPSAQTMIAWIAAKLSVGTEQRIAEASARALGSA